MLKTFFSEVKSALMGKFQLINNTINQRSKSNIFLQFGWWSFAGICALLMALCYYVSILYLSSKQPEIISNTLSRVPVSFENDKIKRDFFAFAFLQILIAMLVAMSYMYSFFSHHTTKPLKITPFLLFISILVMFTTKDPFLLIFVTLSALFFSVSLFFRSPDLPYTVLQPQKKVLRTLYPLICVALLIPGILAWYPIALPNDFYEAEEIFKFNKDNNTVYLEMNKVQYCIEQLNNFTDKETTCNPLSEPEKKFIELNREQLNQLLSASSGWKNGLGRLYYHHSFLYIPAVHWLKYGYDGNVLYLYGYGNTTFYALMMSIYQSVFSEDSTLTSYFNTYPISLLFGMIIISLLIFYCTSSAKTAFISFIICLTTMYYLEFSAAFMAGGSFSSLRYAGLCLQIFSVFFFARANKKEKVCVVIPATALISLWWNMEFGMFGLVCQGLVLLAPTFRMSFSKRLLTIFSLCLSLLIYILFFQLSSDLIKNVYLGFYQFLVPTLKAYKMVNYIILILLIQLVAFLSALTFNSDDRVARICILPTIALVMMKSIYNASEPHVVISLAFVLPLLCIYIPPISVLHVSYLSKYKNNLYYTFLFVLCFICSQMAFSYLSDSKFLKKTFINPYVTACWPDLNETIPSTIPQIYILERVNAIKKVIQNEDSLLLFSPYESILNFYVNPKKYIGGFILIDNVFTQRNEQQIIESVNLNKNALIVYDTDLLTFEKSWNEQPPELSSDDVRGTSKMRLYDLFQKILPNLERVGKDGHLIFYRIKQNQE